MRRTILTAAMLVAGALAPVAVGQPDTAQPPAKAAQPAATLKVGDKAPQLSIEKWVKGEPITGFEKGRVYVVEFWATWCGPCVASMPHLSAMQKEYKDRVTIIGVTTMDPNNSLAQVEEMVKAKGDGMGYTVAWDKSKETNNAYMKAANRNGIPCSFVVDPNGTVAYIGHPMWLDLCLEKVVKGTWDPKAGMAEINAAEKKLGAVSQKAASDPKEALVLLAAFEKEYPAAAEVLGDMKYSLMVKANDPKAGEVGREMVAKAIKSNDATKLNEIAWGIVDPDATIEKRDLDLAMTAATKAVEFTKEKDGAILDTLAWTYFQKGDTAKAIEIEKKAIAASPANLKGQLEESLKKFEDKKN